MHGQPCRMQIKYTYLLTYLLRYDPIRNNAIRQNNQYAFLINFCTYYSVKMPVGCVPSLPQSH